MEKLRYYLYEIMSVSTGLALIAFFGTLSFFPMEIMMMGEGGTLSWIFIMITFGLIISFLLLSFIKKKYRFFITRFFDVATIICAIFVITTYLAFTQDLFEPWFVQVAWFLRYHGFIVGLLLGFITMKTTAGLSTIISVFNSSEGTNDLGEEKGEGTSFKLLTLVIISLSFGFYSLEMLMFRYISFLVVLVLIFVIGLGALFYSIIIFTNNNYYNHIELLFFNNSGQKPVNCSNKTELNLNKLNNKLNEANSSIVSRVSSKLKSVGTRPSEFRLLFVPLLGVLILGIVTLALIPFDITLHIAIPWEAGPIEYDMPLNQLFSYILIFVTFMILVFVVYGGRMTRRLGKYYEKGIKSKLKISSFGVIDAFRFIGLFLVLSQILYFFEYPIYLPMIISFFLLGGILGAIVYFITGKTPKLRKILYIIAILILLLNFYLIFIDGLTYGVNAYSGEYDILFPFVYLHSWLNFILVGVPVGIIVSDLFLNLAFKHTDGTDSTNRALFIAVTPFVLGMLMIPGNYLLNNPGGNPALTDQTYFTFYLFCIALSIVLLVGLCFNYLVTEILVPKYIEKKTKIKEKPVIKRTTKKILNTRTKVKKGPSRKKRVLGLSLTAMIVVSFVGGFGIYYSYSQAYQRPILVHNPGNYIIWLQNSTERVARNTQICTRTSPQIDAVEIYLAKNEYAAFQLVWRPLGGAINSLTYQINDFEHQSSSYNISAGNCSLRYVDWVLEDEFPDVLRPFTTMDLDKKENYIFWFAIRTPYNASAGDYEGELVFTFNGVEEEMIEIHLHVWNFTIPIMRHLRTNIGGRSEDYDRIDNYLEHRINDYGVDIYYTDSIVTLNTQEKYTCYLNKSSDTWLFNWTWWDNMIQYKLDRGMNGFTVTYPLGIADGRDPYLENATRMLWLKNWLTDVQAHLEPKNWLNYSYLYFIDEFSIFIPTGYTKQEYFNRCKALLSEIKNASSKIKIMTTTPPSEELEDLRDYIDIFCPISNDRDKVRWDERLAADCEFWFYTCVGPTAPWPNAMLYNRLYEIRILLWQVWLYNVHGYLFWHSQAFYHGDYGLAFNGYGDGWFLYEQGGVLYDSPRWEMFLEGQEDYEYIWLLNATLTYLEENPGSLPQAEIDNFQAELNTIVSTIVGEKWVYCDHVSTLYAGRERIGSILNQLGGIVNLSSIAEATWYPPYRPGI